MFKFKIEPEIPLLTVTKTGFWSLETVIASEGELRQYLAQLQACGPQTFAIVDVRPSGAQAKDVAQALRTMVERLDRMLPTRTAIITSSGVTKLQQRYAGDARVQVFTSLVLARDWLKRTHRDGNFGAVFDEGSEADADTDLSLVHIHGPSNTDFTLTPRAALETAKRIGDAAMEVLVTNASEALANR